MPYILFLLPFVMLVPFVLIPRMKMERRARALLSEYPRAERKSVYLAFHSGWAAGKGREMDAKIAELRDGGWTYLRATEASPLRTFRSWGGGVTLHFIRTG